MWSAIDKFASQGLGLIIGIILARLLSPKEFGLIGMLTIFISVSTVFVNSGFSQALIRSKNATDDDFSTVFWYNLGVAILFYSLLFFASPLIGNFFNEPILAPMVRVLGLGVIVNALSATQRTKLIKRIDFKLQTRISIISTIGAGIVGITMAYKGFGVWSLVTKTLLDFLITTILLWFWNKWMPNLIFDKRSFKDLFGFGSKLLATDILHVSWRNIYYVVIGKFFPAATLGFYMRAELFKSFPSESISFLVAGVSFPVLSELQDDKEKFTAALRRFIKSTALFTFSAMLGLAAISESLVFSLLGAQWEQTILYLQLFCFYGLIFPVHGLNSNILKVIGRSGLLFRLELLNKILTIPTIFIGVYWGIEAMIIGIGINKFLIYLYNAKRIEPFTGYRLIKQLRDLAPSLIISIFVFFATFLIKWLCNADHTTTLILQILTGSVAFVLVNEIFKLEEYLYLRTIVFEKIKEIKPGKN